MKQKLELIDDEAQNSWISYSTVIPSCTCTIMTSASMLWIQKMYYDYDSCSSSTGTMYNITIVRLLYSIHTRIGTIAYNQCGTIICTHNNATRYAIHNCIKILYWCIIYCYIIIVCLLRSVIILYTGVYMVLQNILKNIK